MSVDMASLACEHWSCITDQTLSKLVSKFQNMQRVERRNMNCISSSVHKCMCLAAARCNLVGLNLEVEQLGV